MAAVTLLGSVTWTTAAGNKTVTATPAVGDLIVIVCGNSGRTTAQPPTVTDNNGSGTYTQVKNATKNTSADSVWVFIRTATIASATSTVFTSTQSGDSGGGLAVFKVTGMSVAGLTAMYNSGNQNNAAAGTPTVSLGKAATSRNPLIGAVFTGSNSSANTAPPSNWTERSDQGYNTPPSGLETATRDSGETGSTITWTAVTATAFCAVVVELITPGAQSFSADAVLQASVTQTFAADAIFSTSQAGSFAADAVISVEQSASFTADAVIAGGGGVTPTRRQLVVNDNGATAAGTVAVTISTPTAGDRMVLAVGWRNNSTSDATPPGAGGDWTQIDRSTTTSGAPDLQYQAWERLADGNEGTTLTVTLPANSLAVIAFVEFYDANGGTFTLDVDASQASSSAGLDNPSVSTGTRADGDEFIAGFLVNNNTSVVTSLNGDLSEVARDFTTNGTAASNVRIIAGELITDNDTASKTNSATLDQAVGTIIHIAAYRVSTAGAASFTADAIVQAIVSSSVSADAVIQASISASFTANAVLQRSQSSSFTADSILQASVSSSFVGDAVIQASVSSSFTANAVISRSQSNTFVADAILSRSMSASFVADAVLQATISASFAADAIVSKEQSATFTADAYIAVTEQSASFTADAILAATQSGSVTADAIVQASIAQTFTGDAVLQASRSATFTADAIVQAAVAQTFTADAVLLASVTSSFTADAVLQVAQGASFTADATIAIVNTASVTADAVLQASVTQAFAADAVIQASRTATFTTDSVVQALVSNGFFADAVVSRAITQTFSADAVLLVEQSSTFTSDAVITVDQTDSFTADARIAGAAADNFTADATIAASQTASFTADAVIVPVGKPIWTTPADGVDISASPTLTFIIPPAGAPMHFQIDIDRVDTFDSAELMVFRSDLDQTDWEYWDGGSWEPIPVGGVDESFAGNEARLTVTETLAAGPWCRRVRGGV